MTRNFERIRNGARSVERYIKDVSTDEALSDCLADLMHFASDSGTDFAECLDRARIHYSNEMETEIMPRKAGAWKVYR